MVTDLQRIANVLKIKGDDEYLVLKIQDVLKAKENKYKKQDFSYSMLKAQNDRLKADIHNLKNEFADSVGIHEYMMVKNSRDNIQKQLNKALEENHNRNEIMRKFNDRAFKDRLKQIEGVR